MPLGFSTKSIDFSDPLKSFGFNPSALVAKGSIVNIDTNETYKFQFNPSTIKTPKIQAVYDVQAIAFRSHEKLQYKHTTGKEWVFQLYLNAISSTGQNVLNLIGTSRNLNNDVAFLESLVYPIQNAGIEDRRPPVCRFIWPNVCNTRVKVMSIGTTYQQFNFRLQQKVTLVDIVLREDPLVSTTSNLVRERGSTGRPGLLGAALDKLPEGFGSSVDQITSFI